MIQNLIYGGLLLIRYYLKETLLEFRLNKDVIVDIKEIIFPLLKDAKMILNLGTWKGREVKWFKEAAPDAQIHMFEPHPRLADYLRKKYSSDINFHIHEMAVSDKDGEAIFYLSSKKGPKDSSSLKKPNIEIFKGAREFHGSIMVKTFKLDTWSKNYSNVFDFIWADIQGQERELINGGIETLKNTKYFYTEYTQKEYYEGAILLNGIIELLSPYFEILDTFPLPDIDGGDILFKNKNSLLFL